MTCKFLKFRFVASGYTVWIKMKFYWSSWVVITIM